MRWQARHRSHCKDWVEKTGQPECTVNAKRERENLDVRMNKDISQIFMEIMALRSGKSST